MAKSLVEEKAELEMMQLSLNIKRLGIRLLEIDEEKIKIKENIEEQTAKLQVLKSGKITKEE